MTTIRCLSVLLSLQCLLLAGCDKPTPAADDNKAASGPPAATDRAQPANNDKPDNGAPDNGEPKKVPGSTDGPIAQISTGDATRDVVVNKIIEAAKARRFEALEGLMAQEFYAVGPADDGEPTRAAALARWKADPKLLDELVTLVTGPCAASESEWICPKDLADAEEYGDAAMVLLHNKDGSWTWDTFVGGGGEDIAAAMQRHSGARKAIRRGRKLSRDKDFAGAVTAFEEARRLAPDSATAACEAGYAEFKRGKLEQARRHLETGLALPLTPNKEAACEFNLGLVAQARGDNEYALRHFKRSLELRESKQAHQRIAKLAPDGACLPPVRELNLAKKSLGLPREYPNVESKAHLVFDKELSDPTPLAKDLRLRVASSAWVSYDGDRFVEDRYDLLLDDGGTLSLLSELGWMIKLDLEQELESVTYEHVDLVPGGETEVIIEAKTRMDNSGSDAQWSACEDEHGEDTPEAEACFSTPAPPKTSVRHLACGKLEGRWVCGESSGGKPSTAEDFAALFRCE